jgi:putative flavoprotein involved in K+ transport
MPFPGDPDGYPDRNEVVAYLEEFATSNDLPIRCNSPVRSLASDGNSFLLTVDDKEIFADQVVVATGPFQSGKIPTLADKLSPEVYQTHSSGYREPSQVPQGRVLVVGGGNTGFQIAKELSKTHSVSLAIGTRQTPLPQRLLGRDLFWWLTKTGIINKTAKSRLGQRMRNRDTLIGSRPRGLKRCGVDLRSRVVGSSKRVVSFADGGELEVDAVIWATGYRSDHSWITPPVVDARGEIVHKRGVSDIPGLYFLGLSWQHTRGSALLGWVKDDAEYLATCIQTVADRRKARLDPANREHPISAEAQEESQYVEPQ